MIKVRVSVGALALVMTLAVPCAPQDLLPRWQVVPTAGVNVTLKRTKDGLVINFTKLGKERRLLLLGTATADIAKAKSVSLRYRLKLTKGEQPKFAILAYGSAGEVWFKISQPPQTAEGEIEWKLPLTGLRPTAYSVAPVEPDMTKIRRLHVGLALDGMCEGVWEVKHIALSTELFRPSHPIVIPISPQSRLSLAHDPLAKAKTEIVREGPEGKWCWKTDFVIPGGRHMYILPSIPMPDVDLTGYKGLQLSYRATLPSGIKALLIILVEQDGSHYYTDWLATPSEEWRTLTIPFSEFRLGGWSKDENGQLDLDQIGSLIVGMHGTTSAPEGKGSISVATISFVP